MSTDRTRGKRSLNFPCSREPIVKASSGQNASWTSPPITLKNIWGDSPPCPSLVLGAVDSARTACGRRAGAWAHRDSWAIAASNPSRTRHSARAGAFARRGGWPPIRVSPHTRCIREGSSGFCVGPMIRDSRLEEPEGGAGDIPAWIEWAVSPVQCRDARSNSLCATAGDRRSLT